MGEMIYELLEINSSLLTGMETVLFISQIDTVVNISMPLLLTMGSVMAKSCFSVTSFFPSVAKELIKAP